MADEFDNPALAKAALEEIMKAFPKGKIAEHFGNFNQIAVYLERKVAEAQKKVTKGSNPR